MKIIIGVDSQFVYHTLKSAQLDLRFPYAKLRALIEGERDEVLDMFVPAVRFPPKDDSLQATAESYDNYFRFARALEQEGAHVIEAPAKVFRGEVKHSDDQRLMIRLALVCARLKPDFLALLAADGDYAPLVWGLREEGIRTKLITDFASLAPDLRRAAYSVSSFHNVLEQLYRE